MALSDKQQRFCDEYLLDLNATQAAIRAGYSEKTAQEQGSRLLSNVMVKSYVEERMKQREKRTEVTQDRVLAELAKIGFSDIRKAVRWGVGVNVTPDTEDVANGIALVSSDEIDDATAAAISEITQTGSGIKVKLHDKRAALVDMGKHLGMFKDKLELTGADGGPLDMNLEVAFIGADRAS